MPQWFSLSTELNGMESYEQGLWEACVIQEAGSECRPYDTILGLDPKFMLARVLMCVSDATCLLGLLLGIPAMSQINCCKSEEGRRTKRGFEDHGWRVFYASLDCLCSFPSPTSLTIL